MNTNKIDGSTTLLAVFFSCYFWRLFIFGSGSLFSVFLFVLLIIGLKKSSAYIYNTQYLGGRTFYYILIGIAISFLSAAYLKNSVIEQLALNRVHTSLTLWRIFEGVLLFFVLILNLTNYVQLIKFLDILYYVSTFLAVLFILGISKYFIKLLGIPLYEEGVYQITLGYESYRATFETLEEGSFGGIMALFTVYSLYKISISNGNVLKYKIAAAILSYAGLLTFARVVSLRLTIGFLLYYFLSTRFQMKRIFKLLLITALVISALIVTDIGHGLFMRFYEIIYNMAGGMNIQQGEAKDSFQYRLMRTLIGVPTTISGWLLGSGGIQTAMIGQSQDHIEYTNWLWQFGLVTFIPLISFFVLTIKKLRNVNKTTTIPEIKGLTAFGISILVGINIHMFAAPSFYYLWIFSGLAVVVLNVARSTTLKLNNSG